MRGTGRAIDSFETPPYPAGAAPDAMTISLPPDLDGLVRDLVDRGDYASSADVVREALLLLEQRRDEAAGLRRLIDEGAEGKTVRMTREQIRDAMGQRMAELRAEVERGERPAPGGPGAIPV